MPYNDDHVRRDSITCELAGGCSMVLTVRRPRDIVPTNFVIVIGENIVIR